MGMFSTATMTQDKPSSDASKTSGMKHDHPQMKDCCKKQDEMKHDCPMMAQGKSMEHRGGMMESMSKDPEMMKHHFTMMLNDSDLRPAFIKMLKDNPDLRQAIENLLGETKK